jgi:osmoprotectant transport system substrate-binding protein
MQELNRQVDVEGRDPADVAYEWMISEGFIVEP